MKGFARFRTLAGALVVLGLPGGAARGEFLTAAKVTLNAASDLASSVAGSNLTLTASYAPASGEAGELVSYAWTLAFAGPGAGQAPGDTPSYSLTSQVSVPLADQVATSGGFTQPVIGFSIVGSTVDLELSGAITPSGADAPAGSDLGIVVDTATSVITLNPISADPGPVTLAGGVTPVPEPATVALIGVGGLLLLVPPLRRRLRRERLRRGG